MTNKEIEQWFERAFARIDLSTELQKLYFGGFDTYEDYEKYGDCFIPAMSAKEAAMRKALK
jgi:hypothetical protein